MELEPVFMTPKEHRRYVLRFSLFVLIVVLFVLRVFGVI